MVDDSSFGMPMQDEAGEECRLGGWLSCSSQQRSFKSCRRSNFPATSQAKHHGRPYRVRARGQTEDQKQVVRHPSGPSYFSES